MFLLAFLGLAFGAGPTGHYVGTKSVLGNLIKVDINSHLPGFFSLKVIGSPGGNVNCPKEAYKVTGDVLTMPNFDKAGDCAHDQFKKASLKYLSGKYDEKADTITVRSRWMFLTTTVVCHKVKNEDELPKMLALPEVQAVPTGHYYGTKSVLGNHIKVNMETVSDGVFSLSITGGPSGDINCPQEAYEIDGDAITMPNYDTEGDCAHDQFKAAKLKFKKGTYDAAEDTITVKARYLFLTVTVVCRKASTDMLPALAAEPTGHYMGTKTVLGYHVTVDMTTGDAGMFSLKVSGAPGGNVDCPKEAYLVDGDELTMPNYQTEGDCAHDQFKAASLKFESATYNAAEDTITVKSKYLFITVTVTCKKQAFEIDGESVAPLQRILDHIDAAQ